MCDIGELSHLQNREMTQIFELKLTIAGMKYLYGQDILISYRFIYPCVAHLTNMLDSHVAKKSQGKLTGKCCKF